MSTTSVRKHRGQPRAHHPDSTTRGIYPNMLKIALTLAATATVAAGEAVQLTKANCK